MSEVNTNEAPVMAAPVAGTTPLAPVIAAAVAATIVPNPNSSIEAKGKAISFKQFCIDRGINAADKPARKEAMKVFDGLKKDFYTRAKAAASVYVSSQDYIVTKCLKSDKSGNVNIICTPKKDDVSIVPVKAKLTAAEARIVELEKQLAEMKAAK
jgi:hypothetical protein